MADARLNSCHLEFPRRQAYRRARDGLLGARGWLTLAAEGLRALAGDEDEGPSSASLPPGGALPGTHYLLVDHRAGYAYPLRTGLNTIGRLPTNDIVFEEIEVSRRHCAILVHAWGGCELHDTASRNGTFVNGRRVGPPVRLVSGDQVRVCRRLLLFVSEADYRAEDEDDDHPETALE
jgi:hypothetical protein